MNPYVFIWHTCFFYCGQICFFKGESVEGAVACIPVYFYAGFQRADAVWGKVFGEPVCPFFIYYITTVSYVGAKHYAKV